MDRPKLDILLARILGPQAELGVCVPLPQNGSFRPNPIGAHSCFAIDGRMPAVESLVLELRVT